MKIERIRELFLAIKSERKKSAQLTIFRCIFVLLNSFVAASSSKEIRITNN